jgi:DNA-directed RNA polymerase specialized sigma24 family protein
MATLVPQYIVTKKIDLQAIVSEYYAALYRFGLALAKNESEAADLAQETVMSRLSRGKEQLRRALAVPGSVVT